MPAMIFIEVLRNPLLQDRAYKNVLKHLLPLKMSSLQVASRPEYNKISNPFCANFLYYKYKDYESQSTFQSPKLASKTIPMLFFEAILKNGYLDRYESVIDKDDSQNLTLSTQPIEYFQIPTFSYFVVDIIGKLSQSAFAARDDVAPDYYTEHYITKQIFLTGLYVPSKDKPDSKQVVRHGFFHLYITRNNDSGVLEDSLIEVASFKYNYGILQLVKYSTFQIIYDQDGHISNITDSACNLAYEFDKTRVIRAIGYNFSYSCDTKIVECHDLYSFKRFFLDFDLNINQLFRMPRGADDYCDEHLEKLLSDSGKIMFIMQDDSESDSYAIDECNSDESHCYCRYHPNMLRLVIGCYKEGKRCGPLYYMKYYVKEEKDIIAFEKCPFNMRGREDNNAYNEYFSLYKFNDPYELGPKVGLNIIFVGTRYFLDDEIVEEKYYRQYWSELIDEFIKQFPYIFPIEIIKIILRYHDDPELMCKFYIDSLSTGSPFIDFPTIGNINRKL
jgi:hypothetical protein